MFDLKFISDGIEEVGSAVVEAGRDVAKTVLDHAPDIVKAGNQDVYDLLATEQHVVKEYLEMPSVLSIRRGRRIIAATDHFILGSVNESDQEKMSFVFTFGDPVLFGGMGRRPRIWTYAGFLKDSLIGGKGISGWRKMYDEYLRGTKCRRNGAIADLRFRDQWRLGYIVASNMSYEESRPMVSTFSFSMFIIESIP